MTQPWVTENREIVLDQAPWITVENHAVRLPNGELIPDWAWVVLPDYVIVAAMTPDGRFLSFRQTKYAVDGESLAAVGGYIDDGEEPLAAAQRELREETGYEADTWIGLGSYAVDPNRGAGVGYFFLARGAQRVTEPAADDLEEQELLLLDRGDIAMALERGEFKVIPWATAFALALLRVGPDDASDDG